MKTITVFTSTYNRAYILPQLYESLKRQTSQDFCWLIVDDGSTDNTKELLDAWINENLIEIRYYYQENGGKMRAHNYGVKLCDTELFLCCDSDDYLTDDAIMTVKSKWLSYNGAKDNISGLIGPICVYDKGYKVKTIIPQGYDILNFREFGRVIGRVTECLLIYRTTIIRQYPFPVQEGEKFMPEGYIHNRIADKYKMVVFTKEIMIANYRDDGYTKNSVNYFFENPKSMAIVKNDTVKRCGFSKRGIIAACDFIISSFLSKKSFSQLYKDSASKFITAIVLPLVPLRYIQLRRKYIQKYSS